MCNDVRNTSVISNREYVQMCTLSQHTRPQRALDSNDGCISIIRMKLNNSEPEQLQKRQMFAGRKEKVWILT